MPFRISTDVRETYLVLSVEGEVTGENILELGTVIRRECDQLHLSAAIVDCAGMTGALSVTELFSVTQQYVAVVGTTIKVAYLNPPKEWVPEDDRFSRTVAQNRGARLELFESEEAAVKWFNA